MAFTLIVRPCVRKNLHLLRLGGWSGGAGHPTIWMTVGQGPLAEVARGVVWTFLLSSILSLLFRPRGGWVVRWCWVNFQSRGVLDDLVPQLPSPFILLGDFNRHNILWGSKDINDKGRIIEFY